MFFINLALKLAGPRLYQYRFLQECCEYKGLILEYKIQGPLYKKYKSNYV